MASDPTIEFFLHFTPKAGPRTVVESTVSDFRNKLERCDGVELVEQIGEDPPSGSKFTDREFCVQITNDPGAVDRVVILLRELLAQKKIEAIKIRVERGWAEYPSTTNDQPERFLRQTDKLLREKIRKRIALLIAGPQYLSNNLPTLKKAQQDVVQMGKILSDTCGFEVRDSIINATTDEIRKAIRDFYALAHEGDFTLLYFSGYVRRGQDTEYNELAFVANDTGWTDLLINSVSTSFITERMRKSGASHLVIVDGYSVEAITATNKALLEQEIVKNFKDSNAAVLAFVNPEQSSTQISGETSLLTTYLIAGIKYLANSRNHVPLMDVYKYALEKLGRQGIPLSSPNFYRIGRLPWFVKVIPEQVAPSRKDPPGRNSGSWLAPLLFVIGAFIFLFILFGNQLSCSLATGKDLDTPEGFLRSQYQFLTQGCYQKAWDMCSAEFQGNAPTFESYKKDMSQFSEVSPKNLTLVGTRTETRATLKADIYYKYKNGGECTQTGYIFYLSRNQKNDPWLLQGARQGEGCVPPK